MCIQQRPPTQLEVQCGFNNVHRPQPRPTTRPTKQKTGSPSQGTAGLYQTNIIYIINLQLYLVCPSYSFAV